MANCITIEGQDQVGKGDATLNLYKLLQQRGLRPMMISYPYYALPFGTLTRMYYTGIDRYKKIPSIQKILGTPRVYEIAGSIYAINRLETLAYLREIVKADEERVLLFDRGAYSLAVTLGYAMYDNSVSEELAPNLMELFLDFDSLLRTSMGMDSVIIQIVSEGIVNTTANGSRATDHSDQYEKEEVQSFVKQAYQLYEQKFPGWHRVVSRVDSPYGSEWVPREDILANIVRILTENGHFPVPPTEENIIDAIKGETLVDYMDAATIADSLYGVKIDRTDYLLWKKGHTGNDKDMIYSVSPNIALDIAKKTHGPRWDDDIAKHVGRIVEQYPELLDMIEEFIGADFKMKFKGSI